MRQKRGLKRLMGLMLVVVLMVSLVAACGNTNSNNAGNAGSGNSSTETAGLFTPGTFTGEAQGNNGPIKVEVTFTKDAIENIKVVSHTETAGVGDAAFDKIPNKIIDGQTLAVDAVSGATIVSDAIVAAVTSCIEQAGGDVAALLANKADDPAEEINKTTDVVVIGGGGSGLQAALKAISDGDSVILIEKNGLLGGATMMNGSNVVATGSKVSNKLFGDNGDSPDLLYSDIDKGSKNTIDTKLTRAMVDNLAEAFDWTAEAAELEYKIAQTQTADHSVDRQVELLSSSSNELIQKVSAKFEQLGGEIMLETSANNLIINDGVVSGVVATSGNDTVTISAKSVIIATGGYGANEELKGPATEGYLYYGPGTSTGDGLTLAASVNAQTMNLDSYKFYPHGWEVKPGIGKLTTYSSKMATDMGAIYVNSSGERLLDEASVYSDFRDKIMEQSDRTAYLVMDEEVWKGFYDLLILHEFTENEIEGFLANNGSKTPIVVKAGSLEEAAKAAGVNSDNLSKTVQAYNGYVDAGKDEQFNKDPQFLSKIEGQTYYIVEQKVRYATSLGGLVVDENTMNVLDVDGNAVKNLYAAGEVVGGANGRDTLPSMMNTWNTVSGYLAGKAAAANAE